MPDTTPPERRDVVIVGGGQAGLAIGHFLTEQGRDFTILEAAEEPAAAWRDRWDSLKLFTPRTLRRRHGVRLTRTRGRRRRIDGDVRRRDECGRRNRHLGDRFGVGHSWIDAPVFDASGRLIHRRAVTQSPGLYFLGLTWQHTRGSALLGWVRDDAEYIADQIGALGPNLPADTRAPDHVG